MNRDRYTTAAEIQRKLFRFVIRILTLIITVLLFIIIIKCNWFCLLCALSFRNTRCWIIACFCTRWKVDMHVNRIWHRLFGTYGRQCDSARYTARKVRELLPGMGSTK